MWKYVLFKAIFYSKMSDDDDIQMIPFPDNDKSSANNSSFDQTPSTSQQESKGEAWQKAQEALKRIGGNQQQVSQSPQQQQQHPCFSFGVPNYVQSTMYQAYPWMYIN